MKKVVMGHVLVVLLLTGLLLPLNTLSASAQPARIVLFETPIGQDTIPGVARPRTDTITLKATIASQNVRARDVYWIRTSIAGGGAFEQQFSTCTPEGESTLCTTSHATSELQSGVFSYIVEYRAPGEIHRSLPKLLTIDNQAPVIREVAFPENAQAERSAAITIVAADRAVPATSSFSGSCAGINRYIVEVKETTQSQEQEITNTLSVPVDSKSCEPVQKTVTVPFTGTDKEHKICVRAEDNAGQRSEEQCGTITLDTQAPVIGQARFLDAQKQTITAVGRTQSTPATLVVTITDKALDDESVQAHLASFGLGTRTPTRREENEFFWEGLYFERSREALESCSVTIVASDEAGTEAEETRACTIELDQTPPKNPQISTSAKATLFGETLPLFFAGSSIQITFDEDGTGLANAQVFLRAETLFPETTRKADSCKKVENRRETQTQWTCSWRLANLAQTQTERHIIRVDETSTDDGGNGMGRTEPIAVFIDANAPTVQDISVSPLFATRESGVRISFAVAGVRGTGTLQDQLTLQLYSDALGVDTITPACSVNPTKARTFDCSAALPVPLDPVEGDVIIATDLNERVVEYTVPIKTYGTIPEDVTDVFKIENIKTTPQILNKRTLTRTDYPVQLTARIRSFVPGVTIATQILRCEDMRSLGQLTKEPLLFNNPEDPNVAALLTFPAHESSTGKIPIACNLHVQAKRGDALFAEEFVLPITTEIPVGDVVLTEQEALDKLLTRINTDISDLNGEIDNLNNRNAALSLYRDITRGVLYAGTALEVANAIVWTGTAASETINNNPIVIAVKIILGIPTGGATILEWGLEEAGSRSLWQNSCDVTNVVRESSSLLWAIGDTPFKSPPKLFAMMQSCNLCNYEDVFDVTFPDTTSTLQVAIDGQGGTATAIQGQTTNELEPYRSLHISESCKCLPGIAYNLAKERQLKCRLRSCIEKNVEVGLPISECNTAYQQAGCLYVEGPAFKAVGNNKQKTFDVKEGNDLMQTFIQAGALSTYALCHSLVAESVLICVPDPLTNVWNPICGITQRSIQIAEMELYSANKYDWDELFEGINTQDFCTQGDDRA